MTDSERAIIGWAEALFDIVKGGTGDVVTLRTDGATFATLFDHVRRMRETGRV